MPATDCREKERTVTRSYGIDIADQYADWLASAPGPVGALTQCVCVARVARLAACVLRSSVAWWWVDRGMPMVSCAIWGNGSEKLFNGVVEAIFSPVGHVLGAKVPRAPHGIPETIDDAVAHPCRSVDDSIRDT
eukprot:5401766-Prymnesium_polylepis.1